MTTGDRVRRLLPPGGESALSSLYDDLSFPDPADDGRPVVYIGMVASVDGSVTVDGVSGPLGGEADRRAFRALRASADAVLVGAGTVRAEGYGGVRLPEEVRASRVAAGRGALPPVVVVTSSVSLEPDARLFQDAERAPWLVVPEDADERRLDRLDGLTDTVLRAGTGRVDLPDALGQLRRLGVRRLLVEGGPGLNAQLLEAGSVDELFLTVAPRLVGGGRRLLEGEIGGPWTVEPVEVYEHDGELLLRLRVRGRA